MQATVWIIVAALSLISGGTKEVSFHSVQFATESDCLTAARQWETGLADATFAKSSKIDFNLKERKLAPKDATLSYSCKEIEKR